MVFPQDSILASILFSLYLLPLGSIFLKYGVSFHVYADDTKLYLPFKHSYSSSIEVLLVCLQEVKLWLKHNFLALYENKTEVVLFGPSTFYDLSDLDHGVLSSYVSPSVKNLGVLFDSGIKFDKQMNYVVKSCFYNLWSKTFSFSKELCNCHPCIYYFTPWLLKFTLLWSKSIINWTPSNGFKILQARLLTGSRTFDRISPILTSLLWLPEFVF